MNILVLGSNGQIGKPLCTHLTKKGHQITGLDITNGPNEDLRYNQLMLDVHFDKADLVIFLAFDVGGSQYLKKYEHTNKFLDNNLRIMKTVFTKLEKWQKPFIFASSQMSNMSHSPYGVLKRLGEFYTRNLNGLIVKFWNVYGVETDPDKTHVITDFINSANTKKQINILTDGLEERQFLHVDDCSKALEALVNNYAALGKSVEYCVTTFMWHDIRRIAEVVANQFPGTVVEHAPDKDVVQRAYRNEATTEILQYWRPTVTLEDGIKKVIKDMNL